MGNNVATARFVVQEIEALINMVMDMLELKGAAQLNYYPDLKPGSRLGNHSINNTSPPNNTNMNNGTMAASGTVNVVQQGNTGGTDPQNAGDQNSGACEQELCEEDPTETRIEGIRFIGDETVQNFEGRIRRFWNGALMPVPLRESGPKAVNCRLHCVPTTTPGQCVLEVEFVEGETNASFNLDLVLTGVLISKLPSPLSQQLHNGFQSNYKPFGSTYSLLTFRNSVTSTIRVSVHRREFENVKQLMEGVLAFKEAGAIPEAKKINIII